MTRGAIAGGAFVISLLLALAVGFRALRRDAFPAAPPSSAVNSTAAAVEEPAHPSFLYGRITARGGESYEGRLRFGGDQEAFWGDYFNGAKRENPWAAFVPRERLPKRRDTFKIFGFELANREAPIGPGRLFMSRFGDITLIEAEGRDVRVTLKSGTAFDLDRFGASDFDDGVRVWDARRGVVDLDSQEIRKIELLPCPRSGAAPARLHGTVRTPHGDFTGFLQWNRKEGTGLDTLDGRAAGGELRLRFDAIRSIARRSSDSSLVTLLDGREIELSGSREVGRGNLGVYVDDRRYGRVLISWDAFERVEFSTGAAGPAYGEFPPGRPLTGVVATRAGRRLSGRLVYDLDESETTETLDAPAQGVDYTIPFGLIASIEPRGREGPGAPRARIRLHSGEDLELERSGDLGEGNAGVLIFTDGQQRPEYVPWMEVQRVDFDRPPAMYPPLGAQDHERAGRPARGFHPQAPPNSRR